MECRYLTWRLPARPSSARQYPKTRRQSWRLSFLKTYEPSVSYCYHKRSAFISKSKEHSLGRILRAVRQETQTAIGQNHDSCQAVHHMEQHKNLLRQDVFGEQRLCDGLHKPDVVVKHLDNVLMIGTKRISVEGGFGHGVYQEAFFL